MVIYEDMLHDGIWRGSNLEFEDGCLYANLSGTRWIVLARNVGGYTIQHEKGTLAVMFEPHIIEKGGSLFRIVDGGVDICIMGENNVVQGNWVNSYRNYLDAEKNYSKSERKVIDRLNSQTQGY